jgi:glycosidase
MIEAMKHWVREYDVDGFRVDVAWGVPVDFFQAARAALDSVKPVFLLAENNNPAYQVAFDSDYDWNLLPVQQKTPLTDIADGASPATVLDPFLQKDLKDYAPSFLRMRFTSNHDEWKDFGTPFQRLNGGVKTFAVLSTTLPGKPLLYNGQEIGWNPADKTAPIAWKDSASGYADFYRTLLRAHVEVPALHGGDFTRVKTDQDGRLFAYHRKRGDSRILVMLNLSSQRTEFTIDLDSLDADWKDLFTGASAKWYASMTLAFDPWEYRVQVAGPKVTAARPSRSLLRAPTSLPRLVLDAQGRLTLHPVGAPSPLDALGRSLLPAGHAAPP